jgi:branched-chain amino acid transport system ATP-binding protein
MTELLQVYGLYKRFGGLVATNNLNLSIETGETHALIGPNGAGKSTLINQLTGEILPSSGRVVFDGVVITSMSVPSRAQLGLARSYQLTSIFSGFSALENVMLAVQAHNGHSFRFWRNARRDSGLREPAMALLERVSLAPRADIVASNLAHGEQRQLEIAMALASQPRMLLLDEPLAGMGKEDGEQIVHLLSELKKDHTILLIEHDMDAVFSLADRISVLVYGAVIATGRPDDIRSNAQVQAAYLGDESGTMETAHA